MSMINPIPTRIETILNAPTQYAIPNYQRDFKWGETEAREFIEDLNSYRGIDTQQLFLGNFIFEPPREQKTNIIDGQQRLTSIMLLLVACKKRAEQLGLAQLAAAIQMKLTFIDAANAETLGCRFIASESIRDIFEYMASGNWTGDFPLRLAGRSVKRQVNRIRPIYEFFSGQTSSFDKKELSQFLRALYDTYVIQISTTDVEEAFSIFERTNARGMDLEVSDLLKNYLFARRVVSIEDRWKEIVGNSNGTLLRMLKYFYVSRLGYVSKPQLYRKLKVYGDEIGAERLTAELAEFAQFYILTKNPTEERTKNYFEAIGLESIRGNQDRCDAVAASLQALQEFGIAQFVPVVYASIEVARRSTAGTPDARAKALIRLLKSLENYHFVNNVVCERVGNEVELLYADTCRELANESDLPRAVDGFIGKLREKRAGFDEFSGRFSEISYSPDTLAIICYIFDRLNNIGLDPAQRLKIYVPDPRYLRRNNNIEHFLPQTPPPELRLDEDTREGIDSIGNLIPLYFRTNSKLGNLPPVEKVRRLRGDLANQIQNLPYVQKFLNRYGDQAENWNMEAITARAKDMAEEAYERVWTF